MPLGRATMIGAGRVIGDQSSITGVLGEAQGPGARLWARGVGATAGRIQAGLGIFGLVGVGLLFNWLANRIKQATAEELHVGTAVKYGKWLNDGTKHMPKKPWWDKGIKEARKELNNSGEFNPLGDIGKPPTSLDRTGVYQGQQFISDVRMLLSGGIAARIASRFAGSASARLFMGALVNKDVNTNMAPALVYQKNLMQQISKMDLVETGCLQHSIAIGKTRREMLEKSKRQCLVALQASDEYSPDDRKDVFVI